MAESAPQMLGLEHGRHAPSAPLPLVLLREARVYLRRIRDFTAWDWACYLAWIGPIAVFFFGTTGFIALGHVNGVVWPAYIWNIPVGIFVFTTSLAIDTIGHRTVYKEHLARGEGHVHHMIVATTIPSVLALLLAYNHPVAMRMPALALIFLSFFYCAIDELMHWRRYFDIGIDRIEMWCHFAAIFGHVIMIATWWQWFDAGYPGVVETLPFLPF